MSNANRCRMGIQEFRPPLSTRKREYQPWYTSQHSQDCEYAGKDFEVPFSKALSDALPAFPYIAMDADVLGGTPRIAGTRIPVSMVIDAVQYYGNIEGAMKSYPDLIADQVKEALSFASVVLERSVEHEFTDSFG